MGLFFIKPKSECLNQYFDSSYNNLVQFKHACLGDYAGRGEKTTLSKCSCAYHKKTGLPCWHMYKKAIDSGLYENVFNNGKYLIPAFEALSSGASKKFKDVLYLGYYDDVHPFSELGRFASPLIASGLIASDQDGFRYSDDVKNNIYFVLNYFMK